MSIARYQTAAAVTVSVTDANANILYGETIPLPVGYANFIFQSTLSLGTVQFQLPYFNLGQPVLAMIRHAGTSDYVRLQVSATPEEDLYLTPGGVIFLYSPGRQAGGGLGPLAYLSTKNGTTQSVEMVLAIYGTAYA